MGRLLETSELATRADEPLARLGPRGSRPFVFGLSRPWRAARWRAITAWFCLDLMRRRNTDRLRQLLVRRHADERPEQWVPSSYDGRGSSSNNVRTCEIQGIS